MDSFYCITILSTFKEECPMKLIFTLSENGQNLVLRKIENTYNHDIVSNVHPLLTKKQKLGQSEKDEILKLKNLKCNKTLLQEYIRDNTGKPILLGDISNIRSTTTVNDLKEVLNILEEYPNSYVKIMTDEVDTLQGIYFQTHQMKRCFSNYPELLLLDATHKLNNLRMPLYILMGIDGNGQVFVACTFILQHENITKFTLDKNFYYIYG
ncbi:hypothetical protein NQ314_003805 [Rhamnusium bicolor]|uniref:ZSWIM1/3 RNaseH-like domain-containing protein n=1 Tax=Rhamnusium bicolor TaxID=1586634 RepID=A0AAV8ZMZ5_9CUCU|nr:hypothetical protein NQ314_003805 [Rhamnusium bicolor]